MSTYGIDATQEGESKNSLVYILLVTNVVNGKNTLELCWVDPNQIKETRVALGKGVRLLNSPYKLT